VLYELPLFTVTPLPDRTLVTEELPQEKLASVAPLKVINAPDAFGVFPPTPAVALKSSIPLFVRFPPTTKE
jgi:hypothetical protein